MNRYWKKIFWNEFGVKVKTYRFWDLWSFTKFYVIVVYRGCNAGVIGELLTDKIFYSPESILKFLQTKIKESEKK